MISILPNFSEPLFRQDCVHQLCWEAVSPLSRSRWYLWLGIAALQLAEGFWIQWVVQYCNYTGPDNSRLTWSENCSYLFFYLYSTLSYANKFAFAAIGWGAGSLWALHHNHECFHPTLSDRLEKQQFHYRKFNSFLTQLLHWLDETILHKCGGSKWQLMQEGLK